MRNKDLSSIKDAIDEKLKIYKAEQIERYKVLDADYYPVLDKCKNDEQVYERFYQDALYLKDFVYFSDHYSYSAPKGMRSFCDMSIENLRTYILWRTHIRKGIYIDVSKEYIYIYINEILNLIGVSPNEGLDKLIFIWNKCDQIPDKEFYNIIKDFCIMYNPMPFNSVMSKFEKRYEYLFIHESMYDGDFSNCLYYLNNRSAQHKIIGSNFYESEKGKVLDLILPLVMEELNRYYRDIGYDFAKMFFEFAEVPYTLFNGNSFVKNKEIRSGYHVSKYEYYFMKNDNLFVSKLVSNKIHNKLISHILKLTESRVRELLIGKPIRIYRHNLYTEQYSFFDSLVNEELENRINNVIDLYLNSEVDKKEIENVNNNNFDNVLKQMKLISFTESGRLFGNDLFIKQVMLLENFEYNINFVYVPFQNATPTFSVMTVDMLKSYFSFRTKVRKGIFEKVDIGYIKLYLNEIMLLCGCKDAYDGLIKLTDFWKAMRSFVKNIDSLMEITIKDFYILNYMDLPYSEVMRCFLKTIFRILS